MKTLFAVLALLSLVACSTVTDLDVCQPGQTGPCKAVDEGLGAGSAD